MKNSDYPPQQGAYIVKVKNGAAWRGYNIARLQISVGGQRHEGEKFDATIDWVASRFDKAIVCVNDTLQRFNDMDKGMSERDAYERSLEAGRLWLLRHMDKLATLPRLKIYRWEEWKGPAFKNSYDAVLKRYHDDESFRQALKEGQKNNLSKDYLLEEIAVFSLMYKKHRAVDIYPGTLPKAMAIFEDQHTTRIDFARKKVA